MKVMISDRKQSDWYARSFQFISFVFVCIFLTEVDVFYQNVSMPLAHLFKSNYEGWKKDMKIRNEEHIGDCQPFH